MFVELVKVCLPVKKYSFFFFEKTEPISASKDILILKKMNLVQVRKIKVLCFIE